jgi:hypothetical protein
VGSFATADPNTRIISLTEPPVGGLVSVRVLEDIYSDLKKDWLTDPDLQKLTFPFEPIGGDPISATETLGRYVFVRNQEGWRIRPFDADHELSVVGNLFARDPDTRLWLSRAGRTIVIQTERSSLATSVQQDALEFSSYSSTVTLDPLSSFTGTTFPVGTLQAPVNNIDDAKLIAAARGLSTIKILSNIAFDADDLSALTLVGGAIGVAITATTNTTVDNTLFEGATLNGSFQGTNCRLKRCQIGSVSYAGEFMEDCTVTGTVTLVGANPIFVLRCLDADPGTGVPTFDLASYTGGALSIRDWSGGVRILNKTTTDTVAIDLSRGRLIVDSTVTDGEIRARGIGTVEDSSTGSAVVLQDEVLSRDAIADSVWDEPISEHAIASSAARALADVVDNVWDANNADHLIPDSAGFNLMALRGQFDRYVIDGGPGKPELEKDGAGLALKGRIRVFSTAAAAAAAVLGAPDDASGELYRASLEAAAVSPGKLDSMKLIGT